MMRKFLFLLLIFVLTISLGTRARAGGVLTTFDLTGNIPAPQPGHVMGKVIGMRWDSRSIPVQFKVNSTLNPIPNPLGAAFLSVADATAVLQQSLNAWNNIPTSFIEMKITGSSINPGLGGFDMVNEITFRTAAPFGAIASSPSVTLVRDTVFTAGMSLDADGDSDVAAGISVATDVDNDGDTEFPEGLYKAGTILDNDVQFNTKTTSGLRFTITDAALDTNTRSVDLMAIAVHEFGHSHGLSHDMNNQIGASDGNGSTMFPFVDTGDPSSEMGQRSLDIDDMAWSSYVYPEGSGATGPGALQTGDIPFNSVFGLISGSVWHRFPNQPVAGASVFATDLATGRLVASAFSGTTQLSVNPVNGAVPPPLNTAVNILDGKYAIPVPKGNYSVGVEAVDGFPVPAGSINLVASVGSFLGQQNFNEEYYNGNREGDGELRSGQASSVHVNPGEEQAGIDITTGRAINVNMFGTRNATGLVGAPAGAYYAVRLPAATIAAINPGEDILVKAIAFDTSVLDASVPVIFAEAMLTTGTASADGFNASINLSDPLAKVSGFLAQDNDFAPLHFKNPQELGRRVRQGIESGEIENLFLVLRVPITLPFPGVTGQAPFIGLDGFPNNDVPIFGLSYISGNGITFTRNTAFNFRFSLVLNEPLIPGNPFVQTFNIPSVACEGLALDGVQYAFSLGGSPSPDCRAGTTAGPGVTDNVQPPNIEGNAAGVLTLTFDVPTTTFGFGVAQSTAISPQNQSVIVDLASPGAGIIRQELSLTTTSDPNFVGGRFDYHGPAVRSATVRFSGSFARFILDGLTYQRTGK